MKKRKNRIAVITIFVISILLVVVAVTLWSKEEQYPKDIDGDGYCQDYYVGADACREFVERHKDTLEYLVKTIEKQSTDAWYVISFNNKEELSIKGVDGDFEYDKDFVEALHNIYSDEIFQMNTDSHMKIDWNAEEGWRIFWQLFIIRHSKTSADVGSMLYYEKPRENYEDEAGFGELEKLSEHWYWECFHGV